MLTALRQLPLFGNLTETQFRCLPQGFEIWLKPGDILFRQGEPAQYFYLVIEGAIQISREVSSQTIVLGTYDAKQFFGEVPLLAGTFHLASGQAIQESHLFCLEEDDFWKMLTLCPELRRTVLGHMANRMQDLQVLSQQREKLAALGTLAAGLAHELNNPASAAHRTAEHLQNSLSILQSLALEFIQAQLIPKQKDHLLMLQQNGLQFSANRYLNDPVVQSEQEDELADWLESQGIANGWKLAPTFVSAGFDTAQLSPLTNHRTLPALIWLEASLTTSTLLMELEQSTNRVAELVQAIKMYSYMDKMPCQEIDIHEGIDNTLIILSHKIKQYNTEVKRKYSLDLPKLLVHGSELNQVWTNLIDNAIDAAGENGAIWIQTFTDNAMLIVEIIDTGPGISPEVLPRIFEPFFTTKAIGKGTGLGLEIAYRIIVNQHHGEIRVRSQPGNTQFQVRLPVPNINQE